MTERIQPLEFDSFPALYYVISRLGVGSFGCAFLTKYRRNLGSLLGASPNKNGTLMEPLCDKVSGKSYSDGLMAVKIMKNRLKKPADYLGVNEIKFILSVPLHPNLLQIFNLFIDTFSGKLHIAMEAMNQNLYQFLQKNERRPLADSVVKSLLAQLLSAIRHIHAHGYFHRDVKPENILVTSSRAYYGKEACPELLKRDAFVLKLCDYGLARHTSNMKELTQYVSTRWYRAPEILLRLKNYSFPIDIWAFASVAVEVMTYRPLFAGLNETDQLWQILKELGNPSLTDRCDEDLGGEWLEGVELAQKLGFSLPYVTPNSIFNIVDSHKKELASIVKLCLMWDPLKRPTANQLARLSYFSNDVLGVEANQPNLSELSLKDSEVAVDAIPNSPLSVSSNKSVAEPNQSSDRRSNESPQMDLYNDPVYLYTKWSQSSSHADISCEETYNIEPATMNVNIPAINDKEPKAEESDHKDLALERFHLQADTSMGSHGILF